MKKIRVWFKKLHTHTHARNPSHPSYIKNFMLLLVRIFSNSLRAFQFYMLSFERVMPKPFVIQLYYIYSAHQIQVIFVKSSCGSIQNVLVVLQYQLLTYSCMVCNSAW